MNTQITWNCHWREIIWWLYVVHYTASDRDVQSTYLQKIKVIFTPHAKFRETQHVLARRTDELLLSATENVRKTYSVMPGCSRCSKELNGYVHSIRVAGKNTKRSMRVWMLFIQSTGRDQSFLRITQTRISWFAMFHWVTGEQSSPACQPIRADVNDVLKSSESYPNRSIGYQINQKSKDQ